MIFEEISLLPPPSNPEKDVPREPRYEDRAGNITKAARYITDVIIKVRKMVNEVFWGLCKAITTFLLV